MMGEVVLCLEPLVVAMLDGISQNGVVYWCLKLEVVEREIIVDVLCYIQVDGLSALLILNVGEYYLLAMANGCRGSSLDIW